MHQKYLGKNHRFKRSLNRLGELLLLILAANVAFGQTPIKVLSSDSIEQLPKVNTTFYQSTQTRPRQNDQLALGMAISGGGSRAQYFSIGLMIGLDEMVSSKSGNSFLEEIDYWSAVSGGSLGAGYYFALKKNRVLEDFPTFLDFWKSEARKDTLSSYIYKEAKLLSLRKLKKYEKGKDKTPLARRIDSELLQYGKTYRDRKIERLYLRDFFVPKSASQKPQLPLFAANGSILNNKARLPFTPQLLDHLHISGSLIPIETFGAAEHGFNCPLAYAIASSNAFPGILPISKYKMKDSKKVIRVVDGGVVDNSGAKTLFELLHSDPLTPSQKKVVLVDCRGEFNGDPTEKNEAIKLFRLLKDAIFFTLDTRYLTLQEDLEMWAKYYDILPENSLQIGFHTLKAHLEIAKSKASEDQVKELERVQRQILKGELDWEEVYRDFVASFESKVNQSQQILVLSDLSKKTIGRKNLTISELPTNFFDDFSLAQIFQLYELSAQVETRLKIYTFEKQILVLAGRYAAYLKQKELKQLLRS